jgi:hypothetical protein
MGMGVFLLLIVPPTARATATRGAAAVHSTKLDQKKCAGA